MLLSWSRVRQSMTRFLLLLLLAGANAATTAHAQNDDNVGWAYLVDGGALPFFWGSAAVAVGAHTLLSPPESPRLFSTDEGGRDRAKSTVPTYQVGILAGVTPVLVALSGTEARLYHAKGAAEAIVSVAALTQVAKNSFGRRRPIYDGESSSTDHRKSFFSGHASMTLVSTTYAGLYLHQHLLARWRDPGQSVAWWELPPLAALAAISVYVPYTRVNDGRHHTSDVLVGAGIGSATAIGFYLYQESRFRADRSEREMRTLTVTPTSHGVSVGGTF